MSNSARDWGSQDQCSFAYSARILLGNLGVRFHLGSWGGISSGTWLRKETAANDSYEKNLYLVFNSFLVSCGLLFEVIFLITKWSSLQQLCFCKQHRMDFMIFYVNRDKFPYPWGRGNRWVIRAGDTVIIERKPLKKLVEREKLIKEWCA